MSEALTLYNTRSRKLEEFKPLNPPHVGIYLCGPTVYGHPHLGHSRGALTIDVLVRYLKHLNYNVRYVRNITDVGHLVGDADEGEDKIGKLAKLNQLEPMEVAQKYTDSYEDCLRLLNTLRPNISPRATGHIQDQIDLVQKIAANGFAYESNGSVYFDVPKYAESHDYGSLSGRVLEDLISGAGEDRRKLTGQDEKRNSADFALWKRAEPEHLMKWDSPWSVGFPGWHIECSAMSTKYLGEFFDIHAGGMDLLFPHHECEIAQCKAGTGSDQANVWIHNNMITINGQKMAKSLNNGILLQELFEGDHHLLDQAFSPETLRFFIMQAHYRSTLDFSNEALLAAQKGLNRLLTTEKLLDTITEGNSSSWSVELWEKDLTKAMNDDMNTPQVIAGLFEGVKKANRLMEGTDSLTEEDLIQFVAAFRTWTFDILGLKHSGEEKEDGTLDGVMELVLDIRAKAKKEKNFELSDQIRDQLSKLGIEVKDGREGSNWSKKA